MNTSRGRIGNGQVLWRFVALVWLAVPSLCHAQTDQAQAVANGAPAGYDQAIEAGLSEHALGHFQESLAHFERAHQLLPSARTLRGLGKVEFELRNYGRAVTLLQGALDAQVNPLTPELRAEVEAVLVRARVYVGEVHVRVEPGTATVSVDGVAVAEGDEGVPITLMVGDHLLEFHANDCLVERRPVRILGGDEVALEVVLTSTAARVQESQEKLKPDERPNKQIKKKWRLRTAVGAVAAGAIVAAVVLTRTTMIRPWTPHPVSSPNLPTQPHRVCPRGRSNASDCSTHRYSFCLPNGSRPAPATRVRLRVQASPQVLATAGSLHVASARLRETGWQAAGMYDRAVADIESWPIDIPVLASVGDEKAPLELVAEARDQAGETLVQARLVTSFVPGQQRLAELVLEGCAAPDDLTTCEGEDCHGTECLTCAGGKCAPTPQVAGTRLSPFDPEAIISGYEQARSPEMDAGDAEAEAGTGETEQPDAADGGSDMMDAAPASNDSAEVGDRRRSAG